MVIICQREPKQTLELSVAGFFFFNTAKDLKVVWIDFLLFSAKKTPQDEILSLRVKEHLSSVMD